jgi:hypothetical protein
MCASARHPPEPIACRTVAGALFAYASLLDAESVRLSVMDEAATAEVFHEITNRVSARAGYYRGIAQRLYDQKGTIRDCEMLVILLQHAAIYVKAATEDLPAQTVYDTRQELLAAIERHTHERD